MIRVYFIFVILLIRPTIFPLFLSSQPFPLFRRKTAIKPPSLCTLFVSGCLSLQCLSGGAQLLSKPLIRQWLNLGNELLGLLRWETIPPFFHCSIEVKNKAISRWPFGIERSYFISKLLHLFKVLITKREVLSGMLVFMAASKPHPTLSKLRSAPHDIKHALLWLALRACLRLSLWLMNLWSILLLRHSVRMVRT
jgi:hypothetical protein